MKDKTAREQVARLEEELREVGAELNRLRQRLGDMELTEARVREIELEWADAFEKFRNLYARIAKRIQREEPDEKTDTELNMNPLAARLFTQKRDSA